MTSQKYDDLISEAFIDPIRSVLIVDDDYPTLNEILATDEKQEECYAGKAWHSDRDAVRRVIEEFRKNDAPYILDIHDGTSPSEEDDKTKVGTLQQTDLLILDYQLEKSEKGGEAALEIAREILSNAHFNLILVHTQEDLDNVFYEFLFGLLSPKFEDCENCKDVDDALDEFIRSHGDKLAGEIGGAQYADARLNKKNALSDLYQGKNKWVQASNILIQSKLDRGLWKRVIFRGLVAFERENKDKFASKSCSADESVEVRDWNADATKYIRTDKGFLAFKGKDGGSLIDAMKQALVAWNPHPSRLMLTKLRAEMNQRGIEVQDAALGRTEVGAMWYLRLLQKKKKQRNIDAMVDQTVRKHTEQLLDQLLAGVRKFAKKILDVDKKEEPHAVVEKRFEMNLSESEPENLKKARMGHNAFVGSKPVNSDHLEIGHILKVDGDYWLCLTPACDMVPGQNRGTRPVKMDEIKRFTALKLVEQTAKKALQNVMQGGHVFANISEGQGHTSPMAFAMADKQNASPTWITMYAENDGYLDNSGGCARVDVVKHVGQKSDSGSSKLTMVRHDAVAVCGHLRYEYALEIQSRFIASQSRIGLEFEGDR